MLLVAVDLQARPEMMGPNPETSEWFLPGVWSL